MRADCVYSDQALWFGWFLNGMKESPKQHKKWILFFWYSAAGNWKQTDRKDWDWEMFGFWENSNPFDENLSSLKTIKDPKWTSQMFLSDEYGNFIESNFEGMICMSGLQTERSFSELWDSQEGKIEREEQWFERNKKEKCQCQCQWYLYLKECQEREHRNGNGNWRNLCNRRV
jgi:hypothetical protein